MDKDILAKKKKEKGKINIKSLPRFLPPIFYLQYETTIFVDNYSNWKNIKNSKDPSKHKQVI